MAVSRIDSFQRTPLYTSLARETAAPSASGSPASGSSLARIGKGWGQTIGDLPEAARDKLVRTANAIAHPISTAKAKLAEIRETPSKVLVPLGITAGSILLTTVAPALMAAAGTLMTASLFITPTVRFVRAKTDEELDAISHQTSRQLVDAGASMAAGWAIGKAIQAGAKYIQKRQGPAMPTVAAGEASIGEVTVNQVPKTPRYDIDVPKLREMVKTDMLAELTGKHPGKSATELTQLLESSEIKREMVQRVRKLVHLDFLKDSGLTMEAAAKLTPDDSAKLRRYFQDLGGSSVATVADATKGVNAAMGQGKIALTDLVTAGERSIYEGRGINPQAFDAFLEAGYTPDQMSKLRRFVDYVAPSQSRKYLPEALKAGIGQKPNLTLVREAALRKVMTDMGFQLPKDVSYGTMIDLLGDLNQETSDSTRRIVGWVNEALGKGERDYTAIREGVLKNMLGEVGVKPEALKALDAAKFVDDTQGWRMDGNLKSMIQELGETQGREAYGRLQTYERLRDRLRVLPDAQRQEALSLVPSLAQNPKQFETQFASLVEQQTAKLVGTDLKTAGALLDGMREQQKANFVSALERMDDGVRRKLFAGLSGDKEAVAKQFVDRIAPVIEKEFSVQLHREAKVAPFSHWSEKKAATITDWDPHGVTELYNGLADMRLANGDMPATLKGTIFAREGKAPDAFLPDHMLPGGRGYRTGYKGQDLVVLNGGALVGSNSSRPVGIPTAEGTVVHEAAHAMQLGGTLKNEAYKHSAAMAEESRLVGEWSKLSKWAEPDKTFADRFWKTPEGPRPYYKDNAVNVLDRATVVSRYGATDTVEDFAEFARYFHTDPTEALRVSPEKYVYLNQFVGGRYTPAQALAHAKAAGLDATRLQTAVDALRTKFGIAM